MPDRAIASTMASAETWTPSRRLQTAAAAERARMEREIERLIMRERELGEQLAGVRQTRDELEAQLQVLNRLAHDIEPTRSLGMADRRLRAVPEPAGSNGHETTVLRG